MADPQHVGQLERLPKWLNLVPIVAQWLWLSLRYGSITLPSCANPAITSGGMVGEGKMEYLASMGPHALSATARTASVLHEGDHTWPRIELAMRAHGLDFPLVVKPDLGWCGYGVRSIPDRQSLQDYVRHFPQGERMVLQEFLASEGEAGLFYMREPGQAHGRLIGMLLRHFPRVTGDGIHSVARLMTLDPRLCRLGRDGLSEPCCDIDRVPAAGEVVRLSTVSSTRVGGLYVDGTPLITPALTQAVDAIARDMKDFHVGRFDVKFDDLKTMQAGVGFKVIEVNGAGSEAVHAWDPAFTLKQAYAIIFDKQRRLFSLAAAMRRRGYRPIGLIALARLHWRQQALIARYPPSN
jgi:hypothetical protein